MNGIIQEFKTFAIRGNVIDMAVGIVIGGSFAKIANSLVSDIIMPPIGLALNKVDFSNLYINLSTNHYDSLAEAQAAGVPTINYGLFVNSLIGFLIVAFALFLLIKQINRLRGATIEEKTKACPHCRSKINPKATRCAFCTSEIKSATKKSTE